MRDGRITKGMIVGIAMLMFLAACGRGGEAPVSGGEKPAEGGTPQKGGTLNIAMTGDVYGAFDPQKAYYGPEWEYLRVMNRTLLAYNGLPEAEGGNDLHPDIAVSMPDMSEDGLTYTFTLKPDVAYAPPLDNVMVKAEDFVRALERTAIPEGSRGGYPFYYSVIKGFDEFGDGKADSIAGLEAIDDTTLKITLNQPAGELPFLMAMPATGPIPANPSDPNAEAGVAEGHIRDYGRFLAATGPYMFEGSEKLDYSKPAEDQKPVTGYQPDRSIVLVRNPNWDAATDDLRPAYVDRIEVTIGGSESDLATKVEQSEIDFVLDSGATPEEIKLFSTTPELQGRLFSDLDDSIAYSSFNMGVPPFDDVHVRKALNLAVNRDAALRVAGGPTSGSVTSHIIPPSMVGGLNSDYNPFPSSGNQGDPVAAKAEMIQSKYDTNGDGLCDAPECEGVLVVSEEQPSSQKRAEILADAAESIGISFDNKPLSIGAMYGKCMDVASKVAICLSAAWGKDFPDGITYGPPLFAGAALSPACCNYQLMGASPDYLKKNGFASDLEIPNVDEALDACGLTTGDERNQCWADFDRMLSTDVVPYVVWRFATYVVSVSDRVNYVFDQFAGAPSLDHIWITS